MATAGSDEDDLWDFTTPGGPAPVELSSGGDTDDDDGVKLLPASKRQKLQKAPWPVKLPELVLSEDDSDAESRDSDYEIIEEMKKANKQKRKALDEIRIPASCPMRVLPARKESDRHMAARAQSLRNRAILESLKADLEAETPEPGEGKEDMHRQHEDEDDRPEEGGGDSQAVDLDRLVVKIKGRNMNDPVKLRIGKQTKLAVLFEKFREHGEQKGLFKAGAALKFKFDGDPIEETDTCAFLEIEEDNVIDVYWD